MRLFRKYILIGNEVEPYVWEAKATEALERGYQPLDIIDICTHEAADGTIHCPMCGALYTGGEWHKVGE